ncbi:HD family phosphohydrolase [Oscillatoria salina]|uniref:HD family phosphohydrolase n=1 Tax=Oscillatoria salina TaxID=331517 RepID=UPI0013BC60F9|nr:HD family phosphohydrolase [Oscillatoria salina]MBZ8182761.1 HD family phosphohydrolase [Oscillatoria salina IIICB1]NET89434.1 HD family phosphohydrolase [Kamptonema sp. SIO1D9]
MRKFHSLTRRIEGWGRRYQNLRWFPFSKETETSKNTTGDPILKGDRSNLESTDVPKRVSRCDRCQTSRTRQAQSPVMFVLAVVSLTSVVGHRFYNQPQLAVGTQAPETIRAPGDAKVEDTKTTEANREAARKALFPILKLDTEVSANVDRELEKILSEIEKLRETAGSFPFLDPEIISLPSQRYLRDSEEWEWRTILVALEQETSEQLSVAELSFSQPDVEKKQGASLLTPALQQAVAELQAYRQATSPEEFNDLLIEISRARQGYTQALSLISEVTGDKFGKEYGVTLLDLREETWQETKQGIRSAKARILTQGIPPGLPDYLLQEAISIQLESFVPALTEPLAQDILLKVLSAKANLVEDQEQTKRRAEQAAENADIEFAEVSKGEIIVKLGEEITQEDFVLLDHFGLSRRGINWTGLFGSAVVCGGAVGIFWLVKRRVSPRLRRRDHILLLLMSLTSPLLAVFGVPYNNLPAIGLLVGSFYGSTLGVTLVSLVTGLVGFGSVGVSAIALSWEYLIAGVAGGTLAAVMAARMRSRDELALLGGAVGLTQGGVNLLVNLIISANAGTIWYAILPEAVVFGLSGLAWTVVALGISPYLERLFDLVTPIRLAELSNPNRPLLKRLATEAPGTFQHTMFVASLAEAAARELHCNVELVRAGTLYHDIGKMHDPLAFIENQMGGPNKHDEINDPWLSAEIIKKHVSEGLIMAKKYGLPKAVRDFIPEHQAKLLISYFYFQAKQQASQRKGRPVLECDFRYDGPIPQSKETGIVMLADACEAALRSLTDATPETALNTVSKIFKSRWQDGQLEDSGLKLEELKTIAEVFVRVWQQYNHKRIAYPKAALEPQQASK